MASLDWETSTAGDVTLVELLVTTDAPVRVTVENALDGPVWPPRRQGVPAEGWDESGFEGVVEDRRVLGYATPADPAAPPARIVSEAPADDAADDLTARDIVRSLGDGTPPWDAIGVAADATDGAAGKRAAPVDRSAEDDRAKSIFFERTKPMPELDDWLDAVESRLDAAERLSTASSVAEASEAVAAAGGLDGVRRLREQVAADREQLARLQSRAGALAERAETTEIPMETLSRLA